MSDEVDKGEEAARKASKWQVQFIDWTWERGVLGKIAVLTLFLIEFTPPIFNGYALYVLGIQLYPTATTLTERIAVLGFLVALANAEILWLRYVLIQSMVFAYVNRRRRRSKGSNQAKLS